MRIRLGLAGKQLVLLLIITFSFFTFHSYTILKETTRIFNDEIFNKHQILIDYTNLYLNLYINNVRNILLSVSHFSQEKNEQLRKFLIQTAENNVDVISNLYLIDNNDNIYSSRQIEMEIFEQQYRYRWKELNRPLFQMEWSEPFTSPLGEKTVNFTMGDEKITSCLEINLHILSDKLTERLREDKFTLVITSPENNTVLIDEYSPILEIKKNHFPIDVSDSFRNLLISTRPDGLPNFIEDQNLLVFSSNTNILNWNVHLIMDSSYFYKLITPIRISIIQTSLFLFVLMFIAAGFVSIFFSRPIHRLANRMDQVISLEELEPIEEKYSDEIGTLVSSYNRMMERINSLTKEKKSLELQMLQYQIGPHFLYNSLSSLGVLARQNRTEEIREMIRAMVELLRFTFDRITEQVTLKEELAILEHFLKIQNIRYGDKISLSIHIGISAQNCLVPALILQPLAENAIFHGLAPLFKKNNDGEIRIEGYEKDGVLHLSLGDNGIGMNDKELKRVMNKIGHERTSLHDGIELKNKENRFTSIGLNNIHGRLKILYGPPHGLSIESKENWGTKITLLLPVRK